jgi:predicted metal-dependent hydrolase
MNLWGKPKPKKPKASPKSEQTRLDFVFMDGITRAIAIKLSKRARRIQIKIDHHDGGVHLTLPANVPSEKGLEFVDKQQTWILTRLQKMDGSKPFEEGMVLPYKGKPHRIVHQPGRGLVKLNSLDREIIVSGAIEHLPRRLLDWLKKEAKKDLGERSAAKAHKIGLTIKQITIRDQKTRWGSCSSNKTLSYSWRLIMAPSDVLDYMAAHEVAHLREMNHRPDFWRLTDSLLDPFTNRIDAQNWLKTEGRKLFSYGRNEE